MNRAERSTIYNTQEKPTIRFIRKRNNHDGYTRKVDKARETMICTQKRQMIYEREVIRYIRKKDERNTQEKQDDIRKNLNQLRNTQEKQDDIRNNL